MDNDNIYLVLQNGTVFKGKSFGYSMQDGGERLGEAVFTTGMTGYLETLTDKSYAGQIIVQTFPLIGNYGFIPADLESGGIYAKGYAVRDICNSPSNFRSAGGLDAFLKAQQTVGIYGIDTRALTKIIREQGTMNAAITKNLDAVNFEKLMSYRIKRAVEAVSVKTAECYGTENSGHKIALIDFGYKNGIINALVKLGCVVTVFPHNAPVRDILMSKPDGIMLSNGPGDPAENTEIIKNLKELVKSKTPVFGICLGHQLLALSAGFKTRKLKYGHRGANQAVRDNETGRIYITSQNHGYAVVTESIDTHTAYESFTNVNDGTCEGIIYKNYPAFSVQFHPEACAGPNDTGFLFNRFLKTIGERKCRAIEV